MFSSRLLWQIYISSLSPTLPTKSRMHPDDILAVRSTFQHSHLMGNGKAAMYVADVIQTAAEEQLLGRPADQEVPQQQRDGSCLAPRWAPAGIHLHRRPLHAVRRLPAR